jgi:hypothetical protein
MLPLMLYLNAGPGWDFKECNSSLLSISSAQFLFMFQKYFKKNLNFFLFFSLFQINIFLIFLNYFNILILKIIFKNILKNNRNYIFIQPQKIFFRPRASQVVVNKLSNLDKLATLFDRGREKKTFFC